MVLQMIILKGLLGYVGDLELISMENCKFKVSLHLKHADGDLEPLAVNLGLKPFRIWKAGSQRATPKGKILNGQYDHSYCCVRLENKKKSSVSELVSKLLDKMEIDYEQWIDFSVSGGELSLIVFNEEDEAERHYVDEFDWQLLGRLSKLRISLGFDV